MSEDIVMMTVANLMDHPLMAEDPVWADTDPRMLELANSIAQAGVLQPLLVDDVGRVGDGRHRCRAARLAGLKKVPCRVLDEHSLVEAMLDSECHRKHRTKTALAYRACIYADAYVQAGIAKRSRNLKNQSNDIQCTLEGIPESHLVKTRQPSEATLADLASKIGVSRNTIMEVKSVWDFVHANPEEHTTDAETYGHVSLKEQIERMVYEEGAGSNAIRDVIRGVHGRNKADPANQTQEARDKKRHTYVKNALKAMDKHFSTWDRWEQEMQLSAMKEIHAHVREWPEAVKAQFRAALGDGGAR